MNDGESPENAALNVYTVMMESAMQRSWMSGVFKDMVEKKGHGSPLCPSLTFPDVY